MPSRPDRAGKAPDFVGVGFEGAGAEWWFDRLLAHPQVALPHDGLRSMHFFDAFCGRPMTPEDVADYHRAFRRRDGVVCGEWTPRYLADPWVPRLLARAAPDAKVLVMVGDPIERYRMAVEERRKRFEDPMQRVMTDVVDRARHATHLRRLHRHVAPERVLVLQLERCLEDPGAELLRTLTFLGVDPRAALEPSTAPAVPAPASAGDEPSLWPDVRAALHTSLDPEAQALAASVRHLDLSLWPNFEHLALDRAPAHA